MLLVLKLLVASLLLYNVVKNQAEVDASWIGCQVYPYGETAVETAAKIKDNLINVVGFLEKQTLPHITDEISPYLIAVKRKLVANSYDVFQLIRYIDQLQSIRSSSERVYFLLTHLESANFKQVCTLECSIERWKVLQEFLSLLDTVPYNLTVHGMPEMGSSQMLLINNIGSKFNRRITAVNSKELAIISEFGPSIAWVVRKIREKKHCFNEQLFGNLLTFYTWPSDDVIGSMALNKLRYYFTSGKTDFLSCGISMSDLNRLIDRPWVLLEYVLSQIDSSGCLRSLEWEIRHLLEGRQLKPTNENVNFEIQSLLDLLFVITPQVYPPHIVVSANRVRRYLQKLLPYIDIGDFVWHRYETREERLLALLDYVNLIDRYPISHVSNSLNAIKSSLLFELESYTISTNLLNLILDSWYTSDLLNYVKEEVVKLKEFVRSHYAILNEILSLHSTVRCRGILFCYMQILSIVQSSDSTNLIEGLAPVYSHIVGGGFENGLGSLVVSYNVSYVKNLLSSITCHNYPVHAVMIANDIAEHISIVSKVIGIRHNPRIYTKEELIVALLKTLFSNKVFNKIRKKVGILMVEVEAKLRGQVLIESHRSKSPLIDISEVTTNNLLKLVNEIRDKNQISPDLDAALVYIKYFAAVFDNWLKNVNCRHLDTFMCFNSILQVIQSKSSTQEVSLHPIRYVLSPSVCTIDFCRWIPFEEWESGPLNPILAVIKLELTNMKQETKHFQLRLDLDVVLIAIQNEDLRDILARYKFNSQFNSIEVIMQFLSLLQNHLQANEDIRMSIEHILQYLNSGTINTLTSQNLFTLIETLLQITTSEAVADSMRETLQLLYNNKHKLTIILQQLKIDCSTLQSCVSTLLLNTNHTTANSIMNLISQAVWPNVCTPTVCTWYDTQTKPTQVLSWMLQHLLQIANNSNTPLAIVTTITRIRLFLVSPQFLPVWNKISSLNINEDNATTTVLEYIAQDRYLDQIITKDAKKILNYILYGTPPTEITVDDLIRLLLSFAESQSNATLLDQISHIITDIQTHPEIWQGILSQLVVECTTPRYCLNNLIAALQHYSHIEDRVTLLLNILQTIETKPPEINEKLTQVLLEQIERLLNNNNIPAIIKIELRVFRLVIFDARLSEFINKFVGVSLDNILVEVLSKLPNSIQVQYSIVDIVADLIRYHVDGVLPTRLSLPSLVELTHFLINMTSSDAVKWELKRAISTLVQLPETSNVLVNLPVNGITLQSIVDSIERQIQLLPSNKFVTQNIYVIVRPPSCNTDVCPWIGVDENMEILAIVEQIKKQLAAALHRPDSVLLLRIYADRLNDYIVGTTISQLGATNLLELLNGLSSMAYPIEVRTAALALLKYINRNIIPTTWTNIDFLGLAQIMESMTDSAVVKQQLQVATNRILFHGPLVNVLLSMCRIDGADVKVVLAKIYQCARAHPYLPSANSLITFIYLPACNPRICPWLNPKESRPPGEDLIPNVVQEINKLLESDAIAFHIKLDLKQIRNMIISKSFKDAILEQNPQFGNSEFGHLIEKAKKKLITILGTGQNKLLTLLEKVPGNVFSTFGVYKNIFNVIYYLAEGVLPHNLEYNTLQQLVQILIGSVKDNSIASQITADINEIYYYPNVESWISNLLVECTTYEKCLASLIIAIEQQSLPPELQNKLINILKPPKCTVEICPWVTVGTDISINIAEEQLKELLTHTNLPIIVQIAILQLIQELQTNKIQPGKLPPFTNLEDFIINIIYSNDWSIHARKLAIIIVNYMKGKTVTQKLNSCRDLHQLVLYIMNHTGDLSVKQQLGVYANRLLYQEKDCDAFVKQCGVVCTDLTPCVAQLYECAESSSLNVAFTVRLIFNPPTCTRLICNWLPTNTETAVQLEGTRNVIVNFEVSDGVWRSLMLDLNNPVIIELLYSLAAGAVLPKGVTVLPVEVRPGEIIHIPIDLSSKHVQKALVSSQYATASFVDLNFMKSVAILWSLKDGRTRWISFDLTNEKTRLELKRLSVRRCLPGRPSVTIRDIDDQHYILCLDYDDILLLLDYIRISVDGNRIVTSPVVVWPHTQSDCWGAVEVNKLSQAELAVIQSFSSINMVGVSVDTFVTYTSTISFNFDIYDSYIRQMLQTFSKGIVPVIDLNRNKSISILVPNDFGTLTNVYIPLNNENIQQLLQLTTSNNPAIPTFYVTVGQQRLPICINLDLPHVRSWILSWYLPHQGVDFVTLTKSQIVQIIQTLATQLQELYTNTALPYTIKLQISRILEVISSSGLQLVDILHNLPNNIQTMIFNNILQIVNATGKDVIRILAQILEQLKYGVSVETGIVQNIDTLINYIVNGVLPETIDASTIKMFFYDLAQNATNVAEVQEILNQILTYPILNEWLDKIWIHCDTYDNCVESLVNTVSMMEEGPLKTLLETFFHIVKVEKPQSAEYLYKSLVNKAKIIAEYLLNDHSIPFEVKLEFLGFLNALHNPSVKNDLIKSLGSMASVTDLVHKVNTLLQKIQSNDMNYFAQLITQLLFTTPKRIVNKHNLKDTIDNIVYYFLQGRAPTIISLGAISGLTQLLSQITTDNVVALTLQDIGLNIFTMKVTVKLPGKCTDLVSCIESLTAQMETLPVESKLTYILHQILRPDNCDHDRCPWVPEDATKTLILEHLLTALHTVLGSKRKEIPLRIILELERILLVLNTKDAQEKLQSILQQLPENELKEMLAKSQYILQWLNSTQDVPVNKLIMSAIENLPNTFVYLVSIANNVNIIKNYFENNVLPETIDWIAFKDFIKMVLEQTNNTQLIQQITDALIELEHYPDKINKILEIMPVKCYTMEFCLQSILEFLQNYPVQSEVISIIVDIVENSVKITNAAKPSPYPGNDESFLVLPINNCMDFVFLNLKSKQVLDVLEFLTIKINPTYPTIIFQVPYYDGVRWKRYKVKLDTNDWSTVQALRKAMRYDLKFMQPIVVENQFGRYIIGIIPDKQNRLHPFVVPDLKVVHQYFLQFSTDYGKGISLPFTDGAVQITEYPDHHIAWWGPLCYIHFPDNIDVQPEYIPLPGDVMVKPDWEILWESTISSHSPATYIPIINSDGSISFIVVDLHNSTLIKQLIDNSKDTQVKPKPESLLVFTDQESGTTYVIDLTNQNVVDALKQISEQQSGSTNPIIINVPDEEGHTRPIVVDLDKLLQILPNITEVIASDLEPTYVYSENSVSVILTIKNGKYGEPITIVLNVSDAEVVRIISELNRPTAPGAVIVTLPGTGTESNHQVYLDLTDEATIRILIDLSKNHTNFNKPGINYDINSGHTIITTPEDGTGSTSYHIAHMTEAIYNKLKELSESNPNAPYVCIVLEDGSIRWLRLDLNSSAVKEILKELAVKVETEGQTSKWLAVSSEDGKIIVLNTANPLVVNQLINMSLPYDQNAEGLYVAVVVDQFGNHHTIVLNMSDASTIEKLEEIQQTTTPGTIRPIEVVTDDGTVGTLVTYTDENGQMHTIIVSATDKAAWKELLEQSDITNPKATKLVINVDNKTVPVYVDLTNPEVQAILNKLVMQVTTSIVVLPSVGTTTETEQSTSRVIVLPINENGHSSYFKCDVGRRDVSAQFLELSHLIGPNPVFVKVVLSNRQVVAIDTTNPAVIAQLRNICSEPRSENNILLITVIDSQNNTVSYVLNILDQTVVDALKQISSQESRPGLTSIQIKDTDGAVVTLYLDLTDTSVLAVLEHLQDISIKYMPEIIVLKDENGKDTVLLIKTYVDGKVTQIVLDLNNKDVIDGLIGFQDTHNVNAIPIEVNTIHGTLKLYLDRLNPIIISKLIKLSQQPKQPDVVNPVIVKPNTVTLTFIGGVHTSTISLNLNDEATKNILLESCVDKTETTKTVLISWDNNTIISCNIETTDSVIAEKLTQVATTVEFHVDSGSLLIIPVPNPDNRTSSYIILDVFQSEVVKVLNELSQLIDDDATTFFFTDKNREVHLCKLNVNKPSIIQTLLELAKYTPAWIQPITIVNPYGPAPFFVTTIFYNGEVKPIVIDLNTVIGRLEQLKVLPGVSVTKPLEIPYVNSKGVYQTITVDIGNSETVRKLLELSVPPYTTTTDILINRLVVESTDSILFIPVQQDNNHLIVLSFDTSNSNVFNELLNLAASPGESSTIVYVQSPSGETIPIRINISDQNVITKLKYISKGYRVKVSPTSVVAFAVDDVKNFKHVIVLDLSNPDVIKELRNLTRLNTENTVTVINIYDQDGNPQVVAVDLQNPIILKSLENLQWETQPNILPVYFPSVYGPKPIVVLTVEDDWHSSLPIVLDTNKADVVNILNSVSNPRDADAFGIEVSSGRKSVRFYINPAKPAVKHALMRASLLTRYGPFPIMAYPLGQLLTIPVETAARVPIRVVVDTSDTYTVETIRNFPEGPADQPGVVIVLPPVQEPGSPTVVRINRRDAYVTDIVQRLGQRLFDVIRPEVIPPSGPLPLLSFYIQVNGTVQSVTLDINQKKVLRSILRHSTTNDRHWNIKRLRFPSLDGKIYTVSLLETPELYQTLLRVTKLSSVIIEPVRQILSNANKPLLTMILKHEDGSSPVTIDTEDEKTLQELSNYNVDIGSDIITIVFNTAKSGKVPIKLSYTDDRVIEALIRLNKKAPFAVVPVQDSYPVISVLIKDNQRIRLDTNNPKVIKVLLRLAMQPDNELYPQTDIAVKNENGLAIPIKIAFKNPLIYDVLVELSKLSPIPPVVILPNHPVKRIPQFPVRVLPPGKQIWPLIFYANQRERIVLDPNNHFVMNTLVEISKQAGKNQNAQTVLLTDIDGNVLRFSIDFTHAATIEELKKLSNRSPLQFEPKPVPYLPSLIVAGSNGIPGQNRPLTVDLQNVEVLNTLIDLSRKFVFKNPYRLQIQTHADSVFCLIDFNDPRVYNVLERFQTNGPAEPYFVTFDVPDTFGNTWRIVIDMENREVMEQLYKSSNATIGKPSTQIHFTDKTGYVHKIALNFNDVSTISLLKKLTLQSTGREAIMVGRKQQFIVEFTATLPHGKEIYFSVDTANESVLKKLKQLSDMFNGKTQTVINLPLPDGKVISVKLDFTDPITLQNLHNLEEESHGGPSRPLIPLEEGPRPVQQLLISFTINSPHYGQVTFTIDLNQPGMIDKMKKLSAMYVPGKPLTQVTIDNQQGESFILQLDLTNPRTVEYLAKLTEESTGRNPLEGKDPGGVTDVQYNLLTLELPAGVEVLPITMNMRDSATVDLLHRLDRNQPFNQSLTAINVPQRGGHGTTQVHIDTTNLQTAEDLAADSIPTVFPTMAPAINLLTYFFLEVPNGIATVEVDLAVRSNVLNLLKISQSVPPQNSHSPASVVEVRDDTGQYLRIPIYLRHPDVVKALLSTFSSVKQIQINADRMPSVVLVIPQGNNLPHITYKFQTKPKVLKALVQLLSPYQRGIAVHVTDVLKNQHQFVLPIGDPALPAQLQAFPLAILISNIKPSSLFIVYAINDAKQMEPIYLNMDIPRTVEVLQRMQSYDNAPLTLVRYKTNRPPGVAYVTLNLMNPTTLASLRKVYYPVGEHSIIKQTVVSRVVLTVPAGSGSMRITLNLANPHVIDGINEITRLADLNGRYTVIELEDPYGFPVILKFNYQDPAVVARLKALDNL